MRGVGCPAVGRGGSHSDSYGDDGDGACAWCGERPRSGATLSGCGLYRYHLWRRWDTGPSVMWIMLNPSTADADEDDPTIRRCVGYAK